MDPRIDELLNTWEEARERGTFLSAETLCADWPAGIPELSRHIATLQRVEGLLALPAIAEPALTTVPGYELLGELGRGGWGIVYRARHRQLCCEHAIKVLRPHAAGQRDAVERFLREAQTLAQLQGQNIVPVYHADWSANQPFFTMPLLPGGNLAEHLPEYAAPPRAARLVEQIARAVQAAHQAGFVHRDIKPSNILLDAQGQPWISDFGIVKLLEQPDLPAMGMTEEPTNPALTGTQQTVGTPAYMAPEQFGGIDAPVTPATDVWALGVVLYEVLTGIMPFTGDTATLRQAILHQEPPSVRLQAPRVSRRLEQVLRKCLSKNPADRYANAGALADALAMAQQPRWRRRHWVLSGGGVLAVLAAVLLLNSPVTAGWRYAWETQRLTAGLRVGQTQELIGGPQAPAHQWRFGTGEVTYRRGATGQYELVVNTFQPALLELLPDPGHDAYELQVQLQQHLCFTNYSCYGIYVGHQTLTVDATPHHFFAEVGGADLGGQSVGARLADGTPAHTFGAKLRLFTPKPANPLSSDCYYHQRWAIHTAQPALINPPGPIRDFIVSVHQGQLCGRVAWNPESFSADLVTGLDAWLPTSPRLAAAREATNLTWTARGGIGIYVHSGRVVVRRLALKPLPAE